MTAKSSHPILPKPHVDGEAPKSCLFRRAKINGTHAVNFAADQVSRCADVIDGIPTAIRPLATLGGVGARKLKPQTFDASACGMFERYGLSLPLHALKSPITRVCPTRLRDDARASHLAFKLQWRFEPPRVYRRVVCSITRSGLIDYIQKMTIAATAVADMKVWAQRS